MSTSLSPVPETMLWTLHNRATEAMRRDGIITDPKAVEIYRAIDTDCGKIFGKAEPSHAVRSLDFDRAVQAFLGECPDGTLVNLGEGLETQRFRIDAPHALWISVDLPEAMATRERFIQPDHQHRHMACSATDERWLDAVPTDKPVFITAQGLLMYFSEEEVRGLIQRIATRFEHATVMFDTIPLWLSRKTLSSKGWKKKTGYKAPPMPWGINRHQIQPTMENWLSRPAHIRVDHYSTFPRGATKWLYRLICSTPILNDHVPSIVTVTLSPHLQHS